MTFDLQAFLKYSKLTHKQAKKMKIKQPEKLQHLILSYKIHNLQNISLTSYSPIGLSLTARHILG